MGKIIIEIVRIDSSKNGFDCNVQTFINANVGEAIWGISTALCEIENSLPEQDRFQFRCDFMNILNKTRKGVFDAE